VPTKYAGIEQRTLVKFSTGERDARRAAAKLGEVMTRWDAQVATWERALNLVVPTAEKARTMAAVWVRAGRPGGGDASDTTPPPGPLPAVDLEFASKFNLPTWSDGTIEGALAAADVTVTPESLHHLRRAPVQTFVDAANGRQVVGGSHTAPDEKDGTAPTLADLLATWERNTTITEASRKDTVRELKRFCRFLTGQDTATPAAVVAESVTRADVVWYRYHLKTTEHITNQTWTQSRAKLGRVFAQAVKDGIIPVDPTAGLADKSKSETEDRLPYTDQEAAKILSAAREETAPHLRWLHWVACFTGCRSGEMLQLLGRNTREQDGIWILDVNRDGEGKRTKTGKAAECALASGTRE
jgi:hypothetical protein